MIAPIFKDQQLQQEFNEKGFVVLPLLSEDEIISLLEIYHYYHQNNNIENSFFASSNLSSYEIKNAIREAIYPIMLKHFENIFINYSYFGSSFLIKTSGENSALAPHQDWTIVDESKFVAINIWTPLCDVDTNNGTLYVVPKSQIKSEIILRAPTIPFYFQNYIDIIKKHSVPIIAKAGTAVILNQSLIHYSEPNLSDKTRIAITSGVKSKAAPMLFHYSNNHTIERYEMPEEFLLQFEDFYKDIYNAPQNGKLIESFQYELPKISAKQFMKNIGIESSGFFTYFRKIFA